MKAIHFLILIAAITLFFMIELFYPFLKSILVALLLAISTNSLMTYIQKKLKNRVISSSILTILLACLFFIPIMYCIIYIAGSFNHIDKTLMLETFDKLKSLVKTIPEEFLFVKEQLNLLLEKVDIPAIVEKIISLSAYLGKNSAKFMMDMVMILIFFFFFTLYSSSMSNYIKDLLPITQGDSDILFSESSNVMTVVLYSILITAVLEGFLFGFFITNFDYDGLFLGVLYGFTSLIPVVGGLIMWLPIAIYEGLVHSLTDAIIITVYSIVMISIIADTFIKPMIIKYINKKVVKTPTKINEILIFFAIIAGLSTFGFWGMIIGPATVTFFISILMILKKYSDRYKENS